MSDVSQDQLVQWLLEDKYGWARARVREFLRQGAEFPPEVMEDLGRVEKGEPLQYVIGWVDFCGCRIDLSFRTLIPRPETEFWVEEVMKGMREERGEEPKKILDLCCGSGCIGVALLKHFPDLKADFVDISEAAISQTSKNLELNEISAGRFHVVQSDLFTQLEESGEEYDLILSNPPYIAVTGEIPEELTYEPQEALFAQKDGLGLIKEIIFKSKKYLKNRGELIMEFGRGQESSVEELARKAGFTSVEVREDQFGVKRWVNLK